MLGAGGGPGGGVPRSAHLPHSSSGDVAWKGPSPRQDPRGGKSDQLSVSVRERALIRCDLCPWGSPSICAAAILIKNGFLSILNPTELQLPASGKLAGKGQRSGLSEINFARMNKRLKRVFASGERAPRFYLFLENKTI